MKNNTGTPSNPSDTTITVMRAIPKRTPNTNTSRNRPEAEDRQNQRRDALRTFGHRYPRERAGPLHRVGSKPAWIMDVAQGPFWNVLTGSNAARAMSRRRKRREGNLRPSTCCPSIGKLDVVHQPAEDAS